MVNVIKPEAKGDYFPFYLEGIGVGVGLIDLGKAVDILFLVEVSYRSHGWARVEVAEDNYRPGFVGYGQSVTDSRNLAFADNLVSLVDFSQVFQVSHCPRNGGLEVDVRYADRFFVESDPSDPLYVMDSSRWANCDPAASWDL